ncbi:MAG: hypothetical protein WC875_03295 [Candidatus Absconditabacterales bacterium]
MDNNEKKDISKLESEQVFFLHQKNVNIISRIKDDIINDLSNYTKIPQSMKGLNNNEFNETLLENYKPLLGEIKYDDFVEERSKYEKTKKEILKRIETLKQDEKIGTLIKLLEEMRGEGMNTTNFIDFYRIILFSQKGNQEQEESRSEVKILVEKLIEKPINETDFIDFIHSISSPQKETKYITSKDFNKINEN